MAAGSGPRTRSRVARDATRETIPFVLGWVVALAVASGFGNDQQIDQQLDPFGGSQNNASHLFITLGAWLAAGFVIKWAAARRLPRWSWPKSAPYTINRGMQSLVGCVTLPAVMRATGGYETSNTTQLWILTGGLFVVAMLIEYGPALLSPSGFAFLRPAGSPPIAATALLIGVSIGAIGVWWIANGLVAGHMVAWTPPADLPVGANIANWGPADPAMVSLGWLSVLTVTVLGLAAWWFGRPVWFYVTSVIVYFWLVLWSQGVWTDIRVGTLAVDSSTAGGLLAAQILSGLLLMLAIVLASLFQPGRIRRFSTSTRWGQRSPNATPATLPDSTRTV